MLIKPKIYWDSGVWIAILMQEKIPQRSHEEIEGYIEAKRCVDQREVELIVSHHVRTELSDYWLKDKIDIFDRLTKRSNVHYIGSSPKSDKLEVEILDYYNQRFSQPGRKMTQKDAGHLAMAIHEKADFFYTFDQGKKKDKINGIKGINLLKLNNIVAGHTLKILKPPPKKQITMGPIWEGKIAKEKIKN